MRCGAIGNHPRREGGFLHFSALLLHIGEGGCGGFAGFFAFPPVVGYASAELQESGITAGACFVPVTGSTFDLTDLKVTGYVESTEADLQIQTLDEYGRTVDTFFYYDVPGELTGWLDINDEEVEPGTVTFQAGEGLWTYCTIDGLGLQSAGMVPTSGVTVNLQESGLSIANPTPVDVDLTNTYVGGYDESTEADVQVQTLDEYGRTVATYFYYDVPDELTGWLDINDEEVALGDVVIKPGQGLWTYCTADGYTFVFPGVDL